MDKTSNILKIVPKEAENIKRIFELYIEGNGVNKIAQILRYEKRENKAGSIEWNRNSVMYILKNEKYKGCSLSQKTITNQGVTIKNRGDNPQYYMENVHEAIISPELFDRVQMLINNHSAQKLIGQNINKYPFTGKIKCEICGYGYSHKIQNGNYAWRTGVWACQNQNLNNKKVCDCTRIKDSVLNEKFVECYNEFITMKYENTNLKNAKQQLQLLLAQEQELTALKVNRMINPQSYHQEVTIIREEVKRVKSEILKYNSNDLKKSDFRQITEFNEEKVEKFIDKVIIHKWVVTFIFINGVSISRPYTNGKAGNKSGWLEHKKDKESKEVK